MNCELTGASRRRRGDAILRGVVARADPARNSGELHENVLRNLTAEPDRYAADLDVADGITFQRRDLKDASQPQTAAPRGRWSRTSRRGSVGCDPAGRVQAIDIEPDGIRERDRRTLPSQRVDAPTDCRIARASRRAVSGAADQRVLIR